MIRLNVFFRVNRSADNEQFKQWATELVNASRQDKGCVAYDVFASLTTPDVYMICETWSDAESLAAHQKAEHFTRLLPLLESVATVKLEEFAK